jgi:adenylyltransferase/sulfurtransferase
MISTSTIKALRHQIASCEAQLADLRQQLAEAEHVQEPKRGEGHDFTSADPFTHDMSYGIHDDFRSEVFAALSHIEDEQPTRRWPLDQTEYRRYGRQLIMPEIGLQGTFPEFHCQYGFCSG